jgi:short-subunit dehydrogenase
MDSSPRPVALVTGASSGIGAALAREFARHGHDLVLVARRAEPMAQLAEELAAGGAATTVIPFDLSRPGAAATLAHDIAERGITLGALVNNAGLGAAGRFDKIETRRIGEMLQVNIVALTELTRLILPGMVARGRGKIMLVASIAGFSPGPHMAVYFASKNYVLSLGEALAYELAGTGVGVTVLCPGATETEFFTIAGSSGTRMGQHMRRMMPAADVASRGYRGLVAGRNVVITGMLNRLLAAAGRFAPRRIVLPVANMMMSEKQR